MGVFACAGVRPKVAARLRSGAACLVLLFPIFLFSLSCAVGGEEYVYEGKSAAQWAQELKAAKVFPNKAQHALAVLGKDAIPALMQLLKDPDPDVDDAALAVLKDVKLDANGVALVLPLLKDESFQVRRAAVRLLGRHVATDQAVAAAVKGALQDKDRAVVEAAEEVFSTKSKLDEEAKLRKRFDKFLADAKTDVTNGNLEDAKVHLELAKSLPLDDAESRERADITAWIITEAGGKQAAEGKRKGEAKFTGKIKDVELQRARDDSNRKQQLEVLLKQGRLLYDKGDLENAHRILFEAVRLFPDDERATSSLKSVNARMQGKGDEDPFAPEKGKKPGADAPEKEFLKQKPAPGEGKGKFKEFDQKPVLPPAPPEGTF